MSDQTPARRELTDAETRLLSRLADAEWALKHAGKDAEEVLNAAVKARADLWAQEQALKLAEHDVEKLRRALAGLVSDIEALMESTDGVLDYDDDGEYHMNWERILPGGKYEYLTHWTAAKDALRETSDEQ